MDYQSTRSSPPKLSPPRSVRSIHSVKTSKTREEICFDRLGKVVMTPEYNTKDAVFKRLMQVDPEGGKNCSWVFDQYKAGLFRLKDVERVRDDIESFFNNTRSTKLPKNYSVLKELLQQYEPKISSTIISEDPDIKILYKGEYGQLLVPLTEAASCKVGSGTKWCTAAKKDNAFERYNSIGPLYVWIDYKRGKKKYQFHFGEVVFMDELDNPLDDELLTYYRTEHPILSQLFHEQEKKMLDEKSAETLSNYAKNVLHERWLEAEPFILTDTRAAYDYASATIKGRWVEAEPIIMTDPSLSYSYAMYVIKGRWVEAEPIIMTDPQAAVSYAQGVLKRRWKEAEPIIMTSTGSGRISPMIQYVRFVIGGRWKEAEPIIKQYPFSAYYYAVAFGRWRSAEPTIMKEPMAAALYAKDVIKGRWIEAEDSIFSDAEASINYLRFLNTPSTKAEEVIIKDPYYAYEYARDVLKQRWLEAEPMIMSNPDTAESYTRFVINKERL
jgi:hypothetical protein